MTNPDELERLARAATEGPWSVDERLEPECVRGRYDDIVVMETERLCDAAFIAAANPTTILDLLSANREMGAALEKISKGGPDAGPVKRQTFQHGFDQGCAWAGRVARSALTTQRGDGE